MNRSLNTLTAIGAVVAALGLAACGQRQQASNDTAEPSVAQSEQRSRDDSAQTADRVRDDARTAAKDAKAAVNDASEKVADKVSDAVITTTVKAELAKDSDLSALKINVDTDSGRVLLRGTAPSPQAREHATSLAAGVKGVASVDNQLTVEPGKQ